MLTLAINQVVGETRVGLISPPLGHQLRSKFFTSAFVSLQGRCLAFELLLIVVIIQRGYRGDAFCCGPARSSAYRLGDKYTGTEGALERTVAVIRVGISVLVWVGLG